MRRFVFVGGGLGDVARRLYHTTTYEILDTLTAPLSVICFSHNPSALEFFRLHPRNRHIVLFDMGHLYTTLIREPDAVNAGVNQALFAACGFAESEYCAKARSPSPLRHFHAPDNIPDASGHVVIHPFGRGWGDWPPEICDSVRAALHAVPRSVRIFVISADYISADGRVKKENFVCDLPNVTVLKNMSAPAAFTLVATASRFIGCMSVFTQVAAFEGTPAVVLHPSRCSDFKEPYSNYASTIWQGNGIAMPYDTTPPAVLVSSLKRFLENPAERPLMREAFHDLDPRAASFPSFVPAAVHEPADRSA